jgi:glycosyltransferase involved in cell wall biosynthesis
MSKPKKLALMLESDGPGGAESVVLTLAHGMRERGIDVRPVAFAPGQGWMSGQLKAAGFELFMPSLARPLDPAFVGRLARWLRKESITHMHAHEFTMSFYAGVAGGLSGVAHTMTMHGGTGFANALRRRIALSASARRASAVVGVSESTCNHLADSLWLRRESIDMVPNGIRVREGNRNSTRASLGLQSAEQLVLAVGNLYEVKGHSILVDAAARLESMQIERPWRIAIAGRGDQRELLERKIGEHGIAHRVSLLGLRNDIPDLLAAADGWVMPSLNEGLPVALLEAFMARVPVVCTAVGGIPSLVRHEETGLLVPPSDADALARALARLLSATHSNEAMVAAAARLAEDRYGQARMIDRYLELYGW